jgi:hypothetical protein
MKCTIPSTKAFYKLLNFIAQFETNVKITCQPAGMSIFCMSTCHSVFIDAKLDPSYCSGDYNCDEQEDICVNLTVLLAALKTGGPKDQLKLCSSQDTISIDIVSEDQVTNYTIRQITIDDETMVVPDIEEDVCINIQPSFFKEWKKKVIDFTKASVTFTPTKTSLELKSEDTTQGAVKVTQLIPSSGIEYETFNGAKSITIGNKNMDKAFNIADVSDVVQVGWKNGMPIRFGTKLTEYSSLKVYLAPMANDEMDED